MTIEEQPDTAQALRDAIETLESIVRDRSVLQGLSVEERTRLLAAAGDVFNPSVVERRRGVKNERKRQKAEKTSRDERLRAETGIRVLREKPVFTTPNYARPQDEPDEPLGEAEDLYCYVCKQAYTQVHHFYDQMCGPCGDFNFAKRTETADLSGRVALLTGGRVKIGYQAGHQAAARGRRADRDDTVPARRGVALLAGAGLRGVGGPARDLRARPPAHAERRGVLHAPARRRATASTSSSATPARRCAARPASTGTCSRPSSRFRTETWAGCSARSTACVARRCCRRRTGSPRRPSCRRCALLPDDLGSQDLFPEGRLDQDLQQVDLRERNSWRLLLDEVSSVELLEVQLVNAVAPFVLNARLKPLMLRTPERDKHIVNVSAVEGQFYRRHKTTRHPHTNMAKAALNMMTRTSAADYYNDGIHMNSVDTGWVTDEDPAHDRRAQGGRAALPARRSTSSTARRASSTRSSTASTPARTSGASS